MIFTSDVWILGQAPDPIAEDGIITKAGFDCTDKFGDSGRIEHRRAFAPKAGARPLSNRSVVEALQGKDSLTVLNKAPQINISEMPFGTMYSASRDAMAG